MNFIPLTNKCIKTLGFVFPVHAQEIDRDTSKHDGQANATHHRLRVQREDQQEGPEQQVDDRPHQTDL